MKKLVVGIMAHVDAGKTTLTEGLLYSAGAIDKLGRVDKRDSYLDTHTIERERGITVFSKQAVINFQDTEITLIDTPGHVDFACEAERAMSVQDYAILVISATDGVTAHTKTLWHMLASRKIPTFIFVNKLDIATRRKEDIMAELCATLTGGFRDFSNESSPDFAESLASCDERLMEEFFEGESLREESIIHAIKKRRIFPCFFGSALKMRGVSEFLSAFDRYTRAPFYSQDRLGAKVYKISRDKSGKRLTYLKITGGELRVKDGLTYRGADGQEITEKVEEIRIYSGERYKAKDGVTAGSVCAVCGLNSSRIGAGIGFEADDVSTLSPVLNYRMILPNGVSPYECYLKFLTLVEEEPALSMSYEPSTKEIRVRLMGEIQLEVLRRLTKDRFGVEVEFDEGRVLYKETVADAVMGAGHFEPLRHYSEVHLRIEPLAEGSGIVADTECPQDTLALNWQRLVMTHIEERQHKGVQIGAPLTDVKITLTAGKAHAKHTEGGDFRQATYRAIRQGLRKAECVLLEPTFDFKIELPRENMGRAINDISMMSGTVTDTEIDDMSTIVYGNCPVSTIRSYPSVLRAYTAGEGKISFTAGKYIPCHNAEEVVAEYGYNPDTDERNTADSVFCKNGSGYVVPWYEADAMMHITDDGRQKVTGEEEKPKIAGGQKTSYRGTADEDKELMRIFESTYGKIKPRKISEKTVNEAAPNKTERPKKIKPRGEEYLIIDGYNLIHAWEELLKLANEDLSSARDKLVRIACNYSAMKRCRVLVVFDAYKQKGTDEKVEEMGAVTVVYTKEAQTADSYIEKTTYEIAGEHYVRVVTSDMQEQFVILGNGAYRVSPKEFVSECRILDEMISESSVAKPK